MGKNLFIAEKKIGAAEYRAYVSGQKGNGRDADFPSGQAYVSELFRKRRNGGKPDDGIPAWVSETGRYLSFVF